MKNLNFDKNLDDIECVQEYYNYSKGKARVALNILTDKELELILRT